MNRARARRRFRGTLAAAAALLVAGAPVAAQSAPAAPAVLPDTGARVRIALADRRRVVGTLVAREPGQWLLRGERGDTLVVPLPAVDRLDVSGGLRSPREAFWRAAKPTAEVIMAVTVVATVATAIAEADDPPCDLCVMSDAGFVGVTGVVAALYGGIVGGLVGLQFRERWTRVPVLPGARLGIVPTTAGAGLAVRLPLPR